MRKAGALTTTRVSVGTEFGLPGSAPAPSDQRPRTKAVKAASFSSPTTPLIFSSALRVASEVVPDPASFSLSFDVSSRAIFRSDSTCSFVSCSFDFNSPAKDESANIASSTGRVTGSPASLLSGAAGVAVGDGDAEAFAFAPGVALVFAALVGAFVIGAQPDAATSSATHSAVIAYEILFILQRSSYSISARRAQALLPGTRVAAPLTLGRVHANTRTQPRGNSRSDRGFLTPHAHAHARP